MYSHYGAGLAECTLTMVRDSSVISLWGGTGRVYSQYGKGLVECTFTMVRDRLSVYLLWGGTG